MQDTHHVTEDQARWLRILESHRYDRSSEPVAIPDDVLEVLLRRGFVHRWRDGAIAITLGGIREVAQH